MKLIKTEDAVGHVLCHDMTQIIPGVIKDAVFRKGHVVTAEDIPVLLSMGKENLYVWEKKEGILHEDEAAEILRDICMGDHMQAGEPKEGKIEIRSEMDGLFKVDTKRLNAVNALGEMMIASRHGNFPVKAGDKLAATRIIPLVIEQEKMEAAKEAAGEKPLFSLLHFTRKKAGLIVTGSEVKKGLVEDSFGPVVKKKLAEYGVSVLWQAYPGDDGETISDTIADFIGQGAELVLCTGGMSVDPDDKTPGAIRRTKARIVSYGAPVLPGAMFLLAYYETGKEQIPVMGLPGCVMYAGRTIFDLVLPRVLAGEILEKEDLSTYGEGGLCLGCEVCTFPNCGFGK